MPVISSADYALIQSYKDDWNKYARDVFGVKLDQQQQQILSAVQLNDRVSVRSGTARGKDYTAAVASLCFFTLNYPSKVICTAPTGRQAIDIMMGEISTIYRNSRIPLGGRLLQDRIRHDNHENWYLEAFKGVDKNLEAWSGFHSHNVMCVMTEATGMDEIIFETVEGILQNNSRFLIVFNPNRLSGEAYRSTRSSRYYKIVLNDLDAPNVLSYLSYKRGEITEKQYRKMFIPGQVDGEWIQDKITEAGWCREISKEEVRQEHYDFEWKGKYYRPGNLFRIKVLGQFPEEDEATLVPMPWIEAAVERYKDWVKINKAPLGNKKIGSDIAGEGRDSSIHLERYDNLVWRIHEFGQQKHMEAVGYILSIRKKGDWVMVDTIGEGAGVYSRLEEKKIPNIISFKNSYSAHNLHDKTGQLRFANLRAFTFWAIRDWLNPQFHSEAMLPSDSNLIQELNEIRYEYRSDGTIAIEAKDDIKVRLGRSPDRADALAMTFAPIRINLNKQSITKMGIF
jgi:hypothetical protein